MLALLLEIVVASGDSDLQCLPMAEKLKTTLTTLPYNEAQALYVVDQCGYNMTYECMQKHKSALMNYPVHALLEGGPKYFCKKLSQANLHGRSSRCNWCISSAALLQKWRSKMEPQKYSDFASDYCYACKRYHQAERCKEIRAGVNSNSGKSAEEVCISLGHCNRRSHV